MAVNFISSFFFSLGYAVFYSAYIRSRTGSALTQANCLFLFLRWVFDAYVAMKMPTHFVASALH
jgi:hypothetical protein